MVFDHQQKCGSAEIFDQPKMWFSRNCSMDLNGFEHHWIGLRENLQETMGFTIKYGAFL